MNLQNWQIFNKVGSPLNWIPESYLNLTFTDVDASGVRAEGYLLTDPSGRIVNAVITDGGYLYDTDLTVSYKYAFSTTDYILTSSDASIITKDVSIFSPEPTNTKSISGLTINLDASYIYPSTTYAGAIFLEPISVGLIETEHLFILEKVDEDTYIRPYDASNSTLVLRMIGDESEISFFTIDQTNAEIIWTDELIIDTSLYTENVPLQINIGFKAEIEGTYERIIRIYHKIGNYLYTLADIAVNAEAVGEDERFRTLLADFGAPDPKDFPQIFKETDINEDLPDWEILNYKSKHMILEHDKIMPFVGTYKALINAIKWLGYDDIYIREWFLNVKENKKLSLVVPFEAPDYIDPSTGLKVLGRTRTLLMFNAEQRKVLKKLNELSLCYCITRETGELDIYGTPITENCYAYNLKEIFIKLLGLKQWLEHNIIGVNCRIVDLTGEGIYFERVQNLIYSTDIIGDTYSIEQTLTPYSPDNDSELVSGDASIRLTLLEITNTRFMDLPFRFIDMAEYVWDPWNPSVYLPIDDPSYLADPSSYLLVGATFGYPFAILSDIMWQLSLEKDYAGVIGSTLVTNPLLVLENELRFYNIFDTSSVFYDASTDLTILLEKAYLRDPSIDTWADSIAYSIYPDPCDNGSYTLESSLGVTTLFDGYVAFIPNVSSRLQYAIDDNYKVPLLSMFNYKFIDASGTPPDFTGKTYYLDILDGKIAMEAGIVPGTSDNTHNVYLNFNYDTSLDEQMITMNVEYFSPRMRLWQVDPSVYYWADPSGLSGGNDPSIYVIDNSIYIMHVNHIGKYDIEIYGWDAFNNLLYNVSREPYLVWIKSPTLYALIDNCCNTVCVSTYMSLNDVSILISQNSFPIYDRNIPLQGLTLELDADGKPYISVPSITYFQDIPEPESYNRFYNMTERVVTISGNDITVDKDYQSFISGDDVKLVKFDKGKYSLIEEVSSHIVTASGTTPNVLTLDQIPASFILDSSTEIYVLNDTYRSTINASNGTGYLTLDISGYSFEVNQLVGIVVTNIKMSQHNYMWGSSYRVTAVNGSTHTFDAPLPEFLFDSSKYTIRAKHAFSTYADITIPTLSATEINNTFKIYLENSYCQEYYLDNTFVLINVLFDQELVNDQWYNASDNLVNSVFYYHSNPVIVDVSTLVILRALYDSSTYLLNQKNIWTVINHDASTILFKVFNESVAYIFNQIGTYDVECIAYDSYGNAIVKKYEGLIDVQ